MKTEKDYILKMVVVRMGETVARGVEIEREKKHTLSLRGPICPHLSLSSSNPKKSRIWHS